MAAESLHLKILKFVKAFWLLNVGTLGLELKEVHGNRGWSFRDLVSKVNACPWDSPGCWDNGAVGEKDNQILAWTSIGIFVEF